MAGAMNGEPLPFEHGFPARLVVSGLYRLCLGTKWLSEIELTAGTFRWLLDPPRLVKAWADQDPFEDRHSAQYRTDRPGPAHDCRRRLGANARNLAS